VLLKNTYRFLFFALLLSPSLSFGQRDSISNLLRVMKAENEQIFQEINKANGLIRSQPEKALTHLENALKLSFKNSNKRGEAYTYYSLGAVNYRLNQYSSSETYFLKSKSLFIAQGDDSALFNLHRYLGLTYEAQDKHNLAQSEYKKYLNKAATYTDQANTITVRSYLARTYYNKKSYALALKEYQAIEKQDPNFNRVDLLENLGKCYARLLDTTNAIKYFKMSDLLTPRKNKEGWSARYYENVSKSNKQSISTEKYVDYQKKAKSQNRKSRNYKAEVQNNVNIANELLLTDRAKSAIPYIKESIDLSKQLGELKETGEAYRQLTEAYEQMGQTEKARASFDQYKAINLELLSVKEQELREQILEQSTFFEKEKQIALLVKERELDNDRILLLEQKQQQDESNLAEQKKINKKQKLVTYVMGTVLLLLMLGIVFMVRSARQKRLANQLLAIRSLRSQMNPHFIFNSLNSVNSFISNSDNRSANKYLTEFAKLMRLVLNHSQKDFVSLEDELEVLSRYLRLEHLRFNDKFDYVLEVSEGIDQSDLFVPPMLIQPYIENAIWHGLRYKKEKGNLAVKIIESESKISFIIEDDGIGRLASQELKTEDQKSRESTGISNTVDRIDLLNKVNHSSIKVAISDINEKSEEQDVGTRVELIVPIKDMMEDSHVQFA
jgi:tetratricopeptide (TPR) repeat protein